ncbi:MAG: uroporphyrinogen decarboxylase family protein [Anaerolineales bacterium]
MAEMSSRERVLAAINHEVPDRVPLILGVDHSTSIAQQAYRKLKQSLDFDAPEHYLHGTWRELGSVRMDEEVLIRLGSDGRGVWDRKSRAIELRNETRDAGSDYVDEFGVGQMESSPGEWFPSHHPLQGSSMEALASYPWPEGNDLSCFEGVSERARMLKDENQYAIFGAPWLIFPFERANQIQGMEKFLTYMITEPDFARALLEKFTQYFKRFVDHFIREAAVPLDIFSLGDDLGTSAGPLLSPKMYREIIKPSHAELIEFVKKRSGAKIWFHSDGDVFQLLDDFIEIGVNILNPIEKSGNMADFEGLKKRYGKKLCFCGAIDTRRLLPQGSPAQVRQEVRDVIQALAPGGGYMLAAVHTIMNDVPAENILAMVDALQEFGRYPLA